MTAAELLIKIQAQGQDELGKVATAVKGVGEGTRLAGAQLKTFDATLNSLVSSGKTYTQALQEMAKSQGVLSSSVVSTSAALLKHMGAMDEAGAATGRFAGQTLQARAAVQALNGQFGTMAAGRWLAQFEALGPILSGVFAIAGPIAFGEVIFHLWERFDPLTKAIKATEAAQASLDRQMVASTARIKDYTAAYIRATQGPAAEKAYLSGLDNNATGDLQRRLDNVNQQLSLATRRANSKEFITNPDARASSLPNAVRGMSAAGPTIPDEMGFSQFILQKSEGDQLSEKIHQLRIEKTSLEDSIRQAASKSKTEGAQSDGSYDKVKLAAEKAAELAKRRLEAEIELHKQLADVGARELTGLDAIKAKTDAMFADFQSKDLLTPQLREDLTLLNLVQGNEYTGKLIASTIKKNRQAIGKDERGEDTLMERGGRMDANEFLKQLRATITGEQRGLDQMLKGIGLDDESDADSVRRGLEVKIRNNQRAVSAGNRSGGSAARGDYAARLDAAKQVFEIETKHLDLIEDEDKRDEKLADARKKRAEEVYRAEADYEEALYALKEQDMKKYEKLSDDIFAAITNRRRGAGFEIGQLLKGEAMSEGKQIFSNLTSPILQTAGHVLGSMTGGSNWGGVLKGTILDPKNGDPSVIQRATADNTKSAADTLKDIFHLISGNGSADPAGATGIAGIGQAARLAASSASGGGAAAILSSLGPAGTALSKLFGSSIPTLPNYQTDHGVYDPDTGSVTYMPGSPSGSSSSGTGMSVLGAVGAMAGGAAAIAQGVSQGGAGGALKAAGGAAAAAGAAISAVAKLAGALSPALAAAGPIGALAGLGLGLVSSLIPNGPEQRALQISTELSKNQYMANTAMNVTQGQNGTYEDFDAHGLLRTSTLSAVPTVAQPYITSRRIGGVLQYGSNPGGPISPYSGGPSGTGVAPVSNTNITIHAMDSESLNTFLQKPANAHAIGESLATHLQNHEGRASNMIRSVAGTA